MPRSAIIFFAMILLFLSQARATEAGWALLRNGGQVVFLSNAYAPGSGDPANFDIDNCRTQRNLSDRGQQQARRIGALIAARSGPVGQVYSSRYCRARETAYLAFGERIVEELAALDSLASGWNDPETAQKAVLDLIGDYKGSGNLFLVTHPENIEAFVGVQVREGEAVIVLINGDGLQKIGNIVFN